MIRTIPVAALLFSLTACDDEDGIVCEAISKPLTGKINEDLIGFWDGSGVDSRIIYYFDTNYEYRLIEPPNVYAPNGLIGEGTYEVIGSEVILSTSEESANSIWVHFTDENTMQSTYEDPVDTSDETFFQTWRRSTCSGFGVD